MNGNRLKYSNLQILGYGIVARKRLCLDMTLMIWKA